MNRELGQFSKKSALALIVLFGIISLFADMNYEGGRSVVGQYLKLLGGGAFALGLASGVGEFVGYALRLISGTWADRTRKYWWFIITGYLIQLSSLPMMAFVSGWDLAIIFLLLERIGKAVRKPAGDAVLSFAAKQTGSGFGFGLHEAMDQVGAFLGPALFSTLLFTTQHQESLKIYRRGLMMLFIPAGITILLTLTAMVLFPKPERFELNSKPPRISTRGFSRFYWLITLSAGLLAMGITDFPLIGLHLKQAGTFNENAIPLLYAGTMAIDAAAALLFGFLYDRFGLRILTLMFLVEILTAPLIFMGSFTMIITGMALWGISVGSQESILKAAIGDRVPQEKRARAFGLFNTIFGLFWFVGSAAIGLLYENWGVGPVVIFSVVVQTGALLVFLRSLKISEPTA